MSCRFLIVILAFVFISTIIPSRISVAGTGVERNGKDFEVEFKVLSDWGRGFNAQIT